MSGYPDNVHPFFRKDPYEGPWGHCDVWCEELGRVATHIKKNGVWTPIDENLLESDEAVRNWPYGRAIIDADRMIKEQYGQEHFYGEIGYGMLLGHREAMDYEERMADS